MTTFAVLRPTPGSASSASRVRGTSPPCWSAIADAVAIMFFGWAFYNSLVRMNFDSSLTPRSAIARGVRATGNNLRVTAFTLLSVACADRITPTSSSNGVWYSSSVVGFGFAARNRSKILRRLSAFIRVPSGLRMGPAFLVGQHRSAIRRAARDTFVVRRVTLAARGGWRQCQGGVRRAGEQGQHHDAVHRAGRDAQLAAGAQRRDHGVHQARRANDRVDRTGRQAPGTADAAFLVDVRHRGCGFLAGLLIERQYRAPG